MNRALIIGINGKMGRMLVETAPECGFTVTGGFDRDKHPTVPTFSTVEAVNVPYDVIIDFSRPELLDTVIFLSRAANAAVVLATTGYDENACAKINRLAKEVPVLKSANMSVGVNMILSLVKQAAKSLTGFDIEIVEKHHNKKVDAPSGTALLLADAAKEARGDVPYVYGRQGHCPRSTGEIGIHAVRGGTIVGEHDVLFCGKDETVTISHTALSRAVFAQGAYRAAAFLQTAKVGLYTMQDVLA